MVHQVILGATRVWIYLPEKPPGTPMPAVFIAPAGVPPFVGNGFGPDLDRQQYPEHLPYVHAGLAVVAYDTPASFRMETIPRSSRCRRRPRRSGMPRREWSMPATPSITY